MPSERDSGGIWPMAAPERPFQCKYEQVEIADAAERVSRAVAILRAAGRRSGEAADGEEKAVAAVGGAEGAEPQK